MNYWFLTLQKYVKKKFEDTKRLTRSRKSKKYRQYRGQDKKDKQMGDKTLHRKLTIEYIEPY